MKGRDFWWLVASIMLSLLLGLFWFDNTFKGYSDLITFLSIMIGFKISSLSILFNSPLRKDLWDKDKGCKPYRTELHRIKDYYKTAIIFDVMSVALMFVYPTCWQFDWWRIHFGKQSLVLPILAGSIYCLYKVCRDLFRVFTYPTND